MERLFQTQPAKDIVVRADGTALIRLAEVSVSGITFTSSVHSETIIWPKTAALLLEYWEGFSQDDRKV